MDEIDAQAYVMEALEDPNRMGGYIRGVRYYVAEPYNMVINCADNIMSAVHATEPHNTYLFSLSQDEPHTYKLHDVKLSKKFVESCYEMMNMKIKLEKATKIATENKPSIQIAFDGVFDRPTNQSPLFG